jgi:hypothetical protein
LILGMSKPEGIYLSVDYRISRSGVLVDDASVKFLTVHYPPLEVGPKVLFAYTGAAFMPDQKTPIGDWLKETIRGGTEDADTSLKHLRSRLDRDLAGFLHRRKIPLIVNAVGIEPNWRYAGGFTNYNKDGSIRRTFDYGMQLMTEPVVFGNGSGWERALKDGHTERLADQLTVRPRDPRDHMKLLATVNRRVAAADSSVSPHCHVSFINADDRFGPMSQDYAEHGTPLELRHRVVLAGVDLSFFEQCAQNFQAGRDGLDGLGLDELNKFLQRRL